MIVAIRGFMSEHDSNRSSTLSYLGAFTLGLVCMGLVVLVVQTLNSSKPATLAPAFEDSLAATPQNDHTFARRAQSLNLEPKKESHPNTIRKASAPPPPAAPLVEISQEVPPVESPDPVSQTISQPEIQRPVSGVVVINAGPATGSIIGRAVLDGKPPQEKRLSLDPACGRLNRTQPTTRFYVTSQDGGLADVFVVVTEGLPNAQWPKPSNPAVLRLAGCLYEPYISAAHIGQQIQIENSDPVMHNAHITPNQSKGFNFSIPSKHSNSFVLTAPELFVRIKCDVHPWEFAYVNVVDHPYFAITDATGHFALPSLRPGKYKVQAYHRKSGELSKEVEINPDESPSIEFRFSVPSESPQYLSAR